MDTYVPSIPPALSERLIWRDGSFHASEELKGDTLLDALFARCSREMDVAVVPCRWYSPRAFEKNFGVHFMNKEGSINATVDAIVDLLRKAWTLRASDIHITYWGPYTTIELRRLGLLQPFQTLNGTEGQALILALFQSDISQGGGESTFSPLEQHDARIAKREYLPEGVFAVRLHAEPILSPFIPGPGTFVALRLLYNATSVQGTLEQRVEALGYLPEQQQLLRRFTERSGLSITAGATGHGKSTLLKHIMEGMAEENPTRNYMTLEDPAEYVIRGTKQRNVITNTNVENARKMEMVNANAGLMRSDPDVIMIGEIRYIELASAAIEAALTGHGVWTTLHASSAFGIIPRLREMGVPLEDLYEDNVLNGLIYQRLVPVLCPRCKRPLELSSLQPQLGNRLEKLFNAAELAQIYTKGDGCEHCSGMGLTGLRVAAEVVPVTTMLLSILKKGSLRDAQMYWLNEMHGMTHVAHARSLVLAGEVDPALAEERLGVTLDFDLEWQAVA